MDRRTELVERATDWALEHGLAGLSLRPLAAALGTSDRMLLYHLGSKDDLLVEIIRCSTRRAVEELRALPPSPDPGAAVRDQWRLRSGEHQTRCERLYVEASTLGLFGTEPYASAVAVTNALWMAAVREHLGGSGVPPDRLDAVAGLVDAAFMGFELDAPLDGPDGPVGLDALAEAVAVLSDSAPAPGARPRAGQPASARA